MSTPTATPTNSLYAEHFGLGEAPFSITPNPQFFFAGSNRGSLLDALRFTVQSDEGIVTVIGEVGSGKTMLCRMLLDDLPAQVDAIYLANPSFSANEILDAIAHDLGVPPCADNAMTRLDALNRELIARYAAGRRVVLLIDEAHAMPPESLEEVRLLSNLETSRHKLLNIVLFGQPELAELLQRPSLRQLRERVVQRFELGPLHADELRDYLAFRLRAAGHRGNFPMTRQAVARIGRTSKGLTRRINILADKALLSCFARNAQQVELDDVRRAERDVGFTAGLHGAMPRPRRWAALAAAIALTTGSAAFAAGLLVGRSADTATPAPATAPSKADDARRDAPAKPMPRAAVMRATDADGTPPAAAPARSALADAETALAHWHAQGGYTVQIAAFRASEAQAEDALARIAADVPWPLAIRREGAAASPVFVVYAGRFDSAAHARRALADLPAPLRANRPVLRSLDALRPTTANRT